MDGGGSTSMAFLVCVAGGICCIYIVCGIHLVATGIYRHFLSQVSNIVQNIFCLYDVTGFTQLHLVVTGIEFHK